MFRLLRLAFVLLLAVIAAAAVAVVYVQQTQLDARAQPGRLETEIALRLRRFAVPAVKRDRTNPVTATPDTIRAGMEHFADHCAVCHGNDGGGDTPFGRGLYPRPPDLRASRTQSMTDGEIYALIENGVRFTGMPGFGGGDDNWNLVVFIRHLPSLTQDELVRMRTLNPQTPEERQQEKEIEDFLNGGPQPPHSHGGRDGR